MSCCFSQPVSRMLATVVEWLTDFLTGAIMESQKAARSKAVASPPWGNRYENYSKILWISKKGQNSLNIFAKSILALLSLLQLWEQTPSIYWMPLLGPLELIRSFIEIRLWQKNKEGRKEQPHKTSVLAKNWQSRILGIEQSRIK